MLCRNGYLADGVTAHNPKAGPYTYLHLNMILYDKSNNWHSMILTKIQPNGQFIDITQYIHIRHSVDKSKNKK